MGIASAKTLVRANFDTNQYSLGIWSLNSRLFQLRRPELIVEQRGRDQVLQVVIALLFDPWMVFVAEAPAAREFEGPLEDVAAYVLNGGGGQNIAHLAIQHSFQYGLTMGERTIFSLCS